MNLISHLRSFIGVSKRATGKQRARKAVLRRAARPVIDTLELRQFLSATTPVDTSSAPNTVLEGAAIGTLVGVTASSTDPVGGTAITYSLSDNAGGRFAIGPASGVVSVANGSLLDGPATHTIVVTAADGAGGSAAQSFSIAVTNLAPTISGNSSVNEGSPYTLLLGDRGSDTITSVVVDWGDGSAPQTVTGNPSSLVHVYPDGNPRQRLGTVLLNELKANAPGPHGPYEYAELRGDPGASLDNFYFVSIEGDADPEPGEPLGAGTAEMVVGLSGRVLGASGLLVIMGNVPGHSIPADTTIVTNANFDTAGKALENGTNSYLVVFSPTPLTEGMDYDADNDGVLELLPPGALIIDGVGWSDGGASDKVYAGVSLTQSSGVPEAATRLFGDTTPNSPAAWFNGALVGDADTLFYNTSRTSVNFPSGGELTPGGSNVPIAVLPQPRLNELKVNPPTAGDAPFEYIELKGAPEQTLIRLFLVVLEGDVEDNAPAGAGRADMVVNLSGVSLGANGLLVITSPTGGHAIPAGAAVFADTQLASGSGLENGSTSFLLVASLNAINEATDYDVNNDGTLELPAGAFIVDAVGWSDGGLGDIVYGGAVLQQPAGAAHAATRFANDSTPSSASAWYSGSLAGTVNDSLTYDLAAVSTNFPAGGALNPGTDNLPPGSPPPTIVVTPDGYAITVRATDEDGTHKTNTLTVTVDNVAPTVTIGGAASVNEGSSFTLTLVPQDPGADTVSTYVVHWGDGSSDSYSAAGAVTHTYADGANVHPITVDVVDEDGAFMNRANAFSVTVNNVAPTVSISGAASLNEGGTYALILATAQDAGADAVSSYIVHWGDGSSGTYSAAGLVTHAYADGQSQYNITVDLVDEDGTHFNRANPLSVTVHDVAPTVAISGPASVSAGSVYSLDLGAAQDPGADTVSSYAVNWGDGTSDTYASGGTVTHTYLASGVFAITIDLVNEDGTFVDRGTPLSVTVQGAGTGLSLAVNQASVSVNEGATAINGGTSSGVVTLAASVGTAVLNLDGTWSWSYAPADGPGQTVVTITATDATGASTSASFDLLVSNVAPAVALSVKSSVNEGSALSLRVTITDPGVLDSQTLVVDWGDGAPQTVFLSPGTTELKLNHTYRDDNPTGTGSDAYTIGVSLTDKDGGSAVAAATITVTNVDPSVKLNAVSAPNQALLRSFNGSVSDAGTLDTLTATVNFGDGSGDQALTLNPDGTFLFSHTYASAGTYEVMVTVADDDGGVRQVKKKVTIKA